MSVVLLLENRRRSLLRGSSSSSRLTTSSHLVEQPPSLHNDSNCEEGEQSLPPPDGLNSSWVALPMNNSNGRDNSKGKNGGLERVPSSMGTRESEAMRKGGIFSAEFLQVFIPFLFLSHVLALELSIYIAKRLSMPSASTY
ncbi:hypothetical protein R6Z07F_017152 [Ovis aries]